MTIKKFDLKENVYVNFSSVYKLSTYDCKKYTPAYKRCT